MISPLVIVNIVRKILNDASIVIVKRRETYYKINGTRHVGWKKVVTVPPLLSMYRSV